MRLLVTGASGFVGSHLCKHLIANNDEVIQTSECGKSNVLLDICNPEQCNSVLKEYCPDVVIHLAAMAFVPAAEKNFSLALKVNVEGTYNIISAAANAGVKKFVFISSSEVYGLTAKTECPLREQSPTKPGNNYALTKLLAEEICLKFANLNKIELVIFRPYNHIGPGQSENFVIPSFAKQIKAAAQGGVIKVGNLDAARDFSDVKDIVRAYRLGALKGSGVYNLGSGQAYKIKDLLSELIKISGKEIVTQIDPERLRPAEVQMIYGDNTKAWNELGWKPNIAINESLKEIYLSL